jgi:glycosyltransferase involved in cell wall biosynthesis
MHVLLVIRDDAQTTLGGDTIQLYKTKEQLEQLGCVVEARAVSEVGSPERYDLAHLFNIQTYESSWAAMEVLQRKGVPTVLSSIYWDMLDHWYEFASTETPVWRTLARAMGKAASRQLYVNWQRRKAPNTREWQLQRRLLEGAVRVLPNSQSEADLLKATFALNGTFQTKVDVVPNGIDPAQYDPLPQPSEKFLAQYGLRDFVIEVGRISPVKNQLGVIEALWDVPVPLVFIGQPEPAAPEYAERCQALGARRGNVTFIERMPHAELPGVYALAKVHVLPSWRETPGLVSLEAAAAGCHIVTTSIGSTRDYFGEQAWYCYPDDHAAIRRGVEAALTAPRSPKLRDRILREFTWRKAGEATLASYRKVLLR